MAAKELTCSSCGRRVTNDGGTVQFSCPACGRSTVTRCKQCRLTAAVYTCPECGFEGPN